MRLLSVFGFALIAGLALNGCATSSAASETPAAGAPSAQSAPPAEDQWTAELKEHHRHHHHGGVAQFIAMSLDTLGADDAKRPQIEKLQDDLHKCMAPAHEAENKVTLALADGIAAGSIDKAKVDSGITQLAAAASAVHDCSAATLNQLHAILSPAERAELVEKVKAHWEVWRQVNHDAEAGGREKGGRLAEFSEELGLTPDQVEKMSAALHTALGGEAGKFDKQKAQAHVDAFAAAFVADPFDAKTITANANGHLATHGATRMALFLETVTPLLTPDQRTKLAEHLRERASHQPAISAK
jgi:Spy/CpxP family protein refolding chaperone